MNNNEADYEVEERAAIRQFDGGQDPDEALRMAKIEIAERNKSGNQ